ncbi:MAG: hypothetical protein JWQ83_2259, partial [Lacunisphaera sp.]|nr:hypothetical protein [Lacunisphaera sp.]
MVCVGVAQKQALNRCILPIEKSGDYQR